MTKWGSTASSEDERLVGESGSGHRTSPRAEARVVLVHTKKKKEA
jgi:hypothetical protein